jgi:hypothetical protein
MIFYKKITGGSTGAPGAKNSFRPFHNRDLQPKCWHCERQILLDRASQSQVRLAA